MRPSLALEIYQKLHAPASQCNGYASHKLQPTTRKKNKETLHALTRYAGTVMQAEQADTATSSNENEELSESVLRSASVPQLHINARKTLASEQHHMHRSVG